MATADPYDFSYLSTAYMTLHIVGGIIGLPLLLVAIFVTKVPRHPSLVNLLIAWVINSVIYCIGVFTGKPVRSLTGTRACYAQAALLHGAPSMSSTAGLIFIGHIYLTLRNPARHIPGGNRLDKKYLIASLMIPYVVFIAFVIASSIVVAKTPDDVSGFNGLYCSIVQSPLTRYGAPLYCAIILFSVTATNVAVVWHCYQVRRNTATTFPLLQEQPGSLASMSMIIRATLFTFYSLCPFVVSIFFLLHRLSSWMFMVSAALPVAALLFFGTQKDLFDVFLGKSGPLMRTKSKQKPEFEFANVYPLQLQVNVCIEHNRNGQDDYLGESGIRSTKNSYCSEESLKHIFSPNL